MLTYFWNDFLTAGHAYDFLAAISKLLACTSNKTLAWKEG